jgi:hypothetical protein
VAPLLAYKRFLLPLLFLLLSGSSVFAQIPAAANTRDAHDKPHGFWYQQHEARMSDPPYTDFGSYIHGRKTGTWYTLDPEGNIAAIEAFRYNTLHGPCKYFENGRLLMTGNYRGLNPDQPYDTIMVVDPITGAENEVVVATDRGSLKHGYWRYYDTETGRLLRQEDYQVDELRSLKTFGVAAEDSAFYLKRIAQMPHNRPLPAGSRQADRGRLIR